MILRAAVSDDAIAVAQIWNRMIRHSLATFTTVEKTVTDLEQLIGERQDAFWVADIGGVVGFATYGAFRTGPGYARTIEHTVILSEAAQGQGAGRALMQQAQDAATAQGHHIMVAGISSANQAAVAFHNALGFQKSGHMPQVGYKQGQWLDLILMQKTLTAR